MCSFSFCLGCMEWVSAVSGCLQGAGMCLSFHAPSSRLLNLSPRLHITVSATLLAPTTSSLEIQKVIQYSEGQINGLETQEFFLAHLKASFDQPLFLHTKQNKTKVALNAALPELIHSVSARKYLTFTALYANSGNRCWVETCFLFRTHTSYLLILLLAHSFTSSFLVTSSP